MLKSCMPFQITLMLTRSLPPQPQGMFSGKYEWSGDREAGDCSIRIFDASEVDDGDWECQVTASSFTAHDALTSRIAELVVRGKRGSGR